MQMGGLRTTTSGQSSPSKFQGSNGFAGTTSVAKSAMILKEQQALERIKLKQVPIQLCFNLYIAKRNRANAGTRALAAENQRKERPKALKGPGT